MLTKVYGNQVLPQLAEIYPQLHVAPAENTEDIYKSIVLSGESAPNDTLAHFRGSPDDSAVMEHTPAGDVLTVTLHERADFECFLQIMAFRCKPAAIPVTQGASMLDGVINWTSIRNHKKEFLKQETESGNSNPDWSSEFQRFTKDKRNYTDALIILSTGPYSALSAENAGMEEEQWLKDSLTIRKYHELTHFICRRLYPEKISAVWDELVADAVGIYAAYGRYDLLLAERCLGIQETVYTGGRLENYIQEEDPARKEELLNRLASVIHPLLLHFETVISGHTDADPFAMAVILEELFNGDITV